MDSPFMDTISQLLADRGVRVCRFEFAYMAARRQGQRKAPPRAERVLEEFEQALAAQPGDRPHFVGGKSYGGRVASLGADNLFTQGRIAGLVCLGYPFHPPGNPQSLRTAHLESLAAPTLICQGTRDPLGNEAEVAGYRLPATISLHWLEDGDHDFKPRKASGFNHETHMASVADRISGWIGQQVGAGAIN